MSAILPVVEVVLGVGFLILFHEFGHYVLARFAGVRVETFSVGFGPRLFGWRAGPTDYRVSAVPLGGYVRLAGESPLGEGTRAPDELSSKSAGWRSAIFLAGIAFNVLLALLLFPVLFAVGIPFLVPLVGEATPGGPAWRAGLETGSRILAINGTEIYSFEQVRQVVALADADEGKPLRLRVALPSGEEREVPIVPSSDGEQGFRVIQIGPAPDPERRVEVDEGTPAWRAGLRTGARLLAVNGVEGDDLFEEFRRAIARGDPVLFKVLEEVDVDEAEVAGERRERTVREIALTPEPRPGKGYQLGIAPVLARVKAVREPLLDPRIQSGDRLVSVDGQPFLDEADHRAARASTRARIALEFEREDGRRFEVVRETPTPPERRRVMDALALESDGNRVVPIPDLPADQAGLRGGDRIVLVNGAEVGSWERIFEEVGRAGASPVLIVLERGGERLPTIVVQPSPRFEYEYGLHPRLASHTYRAESLGAALALGWRATAGVVGDFVLALRRMARREMSPRNLSGIVSIVGLSYRFSQISVAKFLFFLGILSVNLALINALPIPLLDGGHLLFIAIEKLKGSPLSERALTVAQVAGLVVIGGLVVFVTWNDIHRWFF